MSVVMNRMRKTRLAFRMHRIICGRKLLQGERDASKTDDLRTPEGIKWRQIGATTHLRVIERLLRVDDAHVFQIVEKNHGAQFPPVRVIDLRKHHVKLS